MGRQMIQGYTPQGRFQPPGDEIESYATSLAPMLATLVCVCPPFPRNTKGYRIHGQNIQILATYKSEFHPEPAWEIRVS